jgi:hypothetical protein
MEAVQVSHLKGDQNSAHGFNPGLSNLRRCALVKNMVKNNVPAPSCIPLAGLEVLTRNMVELRVTLAVEIAREFGCEDPSYAAIGMS